LDKIKHNRGLEFRLHEIFNDVNFDLPDLELIESKLINEPINKIKNALFSYDFCPIKNESIAKII